MSVPTPLIKPSHAAPWLTPYWEGLRKGEFRLPRCSICGQWEWYPVAERPACAGGHYIWQAMQPDATVFTFTRVERPLLPDVTQPYWTGLVTFDAAPTCRIACLLQPVRDDIQIGARARLSFAGEGDDVFPYFIVESPP